MTEKRTPMTVHIPAELHMALKMLSAYEGIQIRELVTEFVKAGIAARPTPIMSVFNDGQREREYA